MEKELLKKLNKNSVGFILEIDAQPEEDSLEYLNKAKNSLLGRGYYTIKILESKTKKGLYRIHIVNGD